MASLTGLSPYFGFQIIVFNTSNSERKEISRNTIFCLAIFLFLSIITMSEIISSLLVYLFVDGLISKRISGDTQKSSQCNKIK